jgi:anti-anti-sigma factor
MEKASSTRRIELNGECDVSQIQAVASLFEALRPDGPAVIDLTSVTYVDSLFLGELLKLRRRFREHSITLVGATGNVARILRIVQFNQLFTITE